MTPDTAPSLPKTRGARVSRVTLTGTLGSRQDDLAITLCRSLSGARDIGSVPLTGGVRETRVTIDVVMTILTLVTVGHQQLFTLITDIRPPLA